MKLNLVANGSAIQKTKYTESCAYYMSPHCDLDLEVSTPIFSYESPYRVRSQKVQCFRKYGPDKHSLTFWKSLCPWNGTEKYNFLTRYSSLWWYTMKLSRIEKRSPIQRIQQTESYFDYKVLSVTLTLAYQHFCRTLRFMIMHHHIKFGNKKFSGSEDIRWTNIQWQFESLLWLWPWTEQSNFLTGHSGL